MASCTETPERERVCTGDLAVRCCRVLLSSIYSLQNVLRLCEKSAYIDSGNKIATARKFRHCWLWSDLYAEVDHSFDGFMATGGGHDVCIEGAVSFGMPRKM